MRYISILLTLSLLLTSSYGEETTTPIENNNSITFSLKTTNETSVKIQEIEQGLKFEDSKEKIVILSFIAYNGTPCLRALDTFKAMQKKHKDVDVVAIEVRGLNQEGLNNFAKEQSIEFSLITYDNAKDFTSYIAQKAGWNGSLPFTLIMDTKGVVKYLQAGLIPLDGLEKIYQQIK